MQLNGILMQLLRSQHDSSVERLRKFLQSLKNSWSAPETFEFTSTSSGIHHESRKSFAFRFFMTTRSRDCSGEFMNILCVCVHRPVGTCVQCPLMHAAMATNTKNKLKLEVLLCHATIIKDFRGFCCISQTPRRRNYQTVPSANWKQM